jgi:hypothetical protein
MNCQVCNAVLRASGACSHCLWPVGAIAAIADQTLGDDVLRWAQVKYREATTGGFDSRVNVDVPHIKRGSERFSSERVGFSSTPVAEPAFQSRMKAHFGGEDVQGLDSLRSELVALNRKIASTEDQRLGSKAEISKLLQKSQVLEQGIEEVTKAVKGISFFCDQQNKKNQELAEQCYSNQETSEKYEQQIRDLIEEQKQQIAELKLLKSLLTNPHVAKSTINPAAASSTNVPVVTASEVSFTNEELDLIKEYNSNSLEVPSPLRDRAAIVTIDEETFNRLRNGDESNIAFKSDRKGNYFVITRGGFRYLVPTKQRKITALLYNVTKAIYKCSGFSENYKDFSLLKPALVSEESIDCWKLSQPGILEFT